MKTQLCAVREQQKHEQKQNMHLRWKNHVYYGDAKIMAIKNRKASHLPEFLMKNIDWKTIFMKLESNDQSKI